MSDDQKPVQPASASTPASSQSQRILGDAAQKREEQEKVDQYFRERDAKPRGPYRKRVAAY